MDKSTSEQAVSSMDALAVAVLSRLGDCIYAHAQATDRLADAVNRLALATAGEDEGEPMFDMSGRPIG
jgi:hypothetical protein